MRLAAAVVTVVVERTGIQLVVDAVVVVERTGMQRAAADVVFVGGRTGMRLATDVVVVGRKLPYSAIPLPSKAPTNCSRVFWRVLSPSRVWT